jgi:serine/threonine protein kinase
MSSSANQSPASNEILNTKVGTPLTIAKRIGRGRLGVVYAGVHPILARRFAIKVLRPSLTRDDDVQRRLRHMIRETSTVEHPGLVHLIDFGQLEDGTTYVVMDFVRGIQLTKVLTRDGPFPVERAIPLIIQLADALEAAHRVRVVHGDVKPNNIMLVEQSSGGELLRLHDVGLTLALADKSSSDDPLGHLRIYSTFDYLSPEQITNSRVDGRADIYAFGAVAYRILTGEPPFVGDAEEVMLGHRTREPVPPSRRVGAHEVPPEVDVIILRCLEKLPEDRFKSMDEVSHELKALLPRSVPTPFEEEETTGRWKLPPELELAEEPLPEAPARLRQMFTDTLLELADLVAKEGAANEELLFEMTSLRQLRDDAASTAAQSAVTENRFEDIRRELRERESTLRYAIIDLNLARSDAVDRNATETELEEQDFQIAELERSLTELEQQRTERFTALNIELQKHRDALKSFDETMALHLRRIYAYLDDARMEVTTEEGRRLFYLLERCRNALSKSVA